MFQRFRLQRLLHNAPRYDVLVIHGVPASEMSSVIRQIEARGWTFLRAEATGTRGGEVIYDLYFARETNSAARQEHGIAHLLPHETPPSTT